MADELAQVAKPGDPGLDIHITGLRIAELVVLPADQVTRLAVTFDTSEAAGFWIDSSTGERVIPDTVTSYEITAGLRVAPGYELLLHMMISRLEAWQADRSLITSTSAPGKWTLLHCPGHPAGGMVPIPRTGAVNPAAGPREDENHA